MNESSDTVEKETSHGTIGTDSMILANQFFILGCLVFLVLTSPHLEADPKSAANLLMLVWIGGVAMLLSRPLARTLKTVEEWWGGRSV